MTIKHTLTTAFAVTAISGYAQAALTSGLVGYFDFESGFTNQAGAVGSDVSGTFVNGSAQNGAVAGVSGGQAGNAMELRSTGGSANEHMNVAIGYGGAASTSNLGTSFTVSTWYNLDSPPSGSSSNRYFVYEGETSFDVSYGLRDLSLGAAGINDGQVFTQNGATGGTPQNNQIDIADAGVAGWHHILQTYESSGGTTTITTYIDGVALGNVLSLTTADIVDSGMNFGAPRSTTTTRGFDGKIDEVALWSRALDAGEISEVYTLGITGQAIPEPSSSALIGLAGIGLILRRRR